MDNFYSSEKSGGGVPINTVLPIKSSSIVYNSNDGTVWLKSGFLETDTSIYPNASVNIGLDAVYTGNSLNPSAQTSDPRGVFVKPDGLSVYVIGTSGNAAFQYTLSEAWDLNSAVYANKSFVYTSRGTNANDIFFTDDGLTMFILQSSNDDIDQYVLSVAWDISTASYAGKTYSFAVNVAANGFTFKFDGSQLFVPHGGGFLTVNLSTPFDVSTGSGEVNTLWSSINTEGAVLTGPKSLEFTLSGFVMIVGGSSGGRGFEFFSLSTAYDISTAIVFSDGFIDSTPETSTQFDGFRLSNSFLYAVSAATDKIFKYGTVGDIGISVPSFDSDSGTAIYMRVK